MPGLSANANAPPRPAVQLLDPAHPRILRSLRAERLVTAHCALASSVSRQVDIIVPTIAPTTLFAAVVLTGIGALGRGRVVGHGER